MSDEKRTIGAWEVMQGIHIGDKEVLLLFDPKSAEAPYAVCYCQRIPDLGLELPSEAIGSADYLEMTDEFLLRVQGQIAQVRAERERSGEPQEVFGREHCLPSDGTSMELLGCVAIMKPEVLRPEYRNAAHQIVLVSGGFGAYKMARGRAVFGNTVFSGEKSNWQRGDVLGILDPAKAPEWVKPGVEAIRAQQKEKGGKEHER